MVIKGVEHFYNEDRERWEIPFSFAEAYEEYIKNSNVLTVKDIDKLINNPDNSSDWIDQFMKYPNDAGKTITEIKREANSYYNLPLNMNQLIKYGI